MRNMKKVLLSILILVAVLVGGFYALNSYIYHQKQAGNSDPACAQVLTDARDPKTGHVGTFPTPCDVPGGWEVLTGADNTFKRGEETLRAYTNPALSIRFEYRVEPDGYILIDQQEENVPDTSLVDYVSLFDTSEYLELVVSSEPREAPPGISILVFENSNDETALEWIAAHDIVSNASLALTEPVETLVSGESAIRYTTDGLYTTDNIVVAHNGNIYLFTGGYTSEEAVIRDDFEDIINSVSLY